MIFEYFLDVSEKQANFEWTDQDRRLCNFLVEIGKLSA